MVDLSICICTYKRPLLLKRLLQAILDQTLSGTSVEVIVIDNDAEGSAAAILYQMAGLFGNGLKSLNLAYPNISLARNAAIAAATGTWVVMIDDDEVPVLEWLAQLVHVQKAHHADVVFAPVLPEYSEQTPEWIRRGGFFDRRRLTTGTLIDHRDARSGNVMVRHTLLNALTEAQKGQAGPFDPAFGTTGGEDTMLFRQLARFGAIMVWCDEAPAYEAIPADRATAKWLLQRSYRTGQLFIRTELAMLAGTRKWLLALVLSGRACLQFVVALVLATVCLPVRSLRSFYWLRIAASQLGKLSYFWGRAVHAYGNQKDYL